MNPSETIHEMSSLPPLREGSRHLAWNGVSFTVPSNWEIAVFRSLRRGASRIELEDEYTLRMEAEWIFSQKGKLDTRTIIKRYEAASKPLTLKAEDQKEITDLPEGWHATWFIFRETGKNKKAGQLEVIEHSLVTMFHICPDHSLFCFFLLHFMPEDPEVPVDIVRELAAGFKNNGRRAMIPWRLFDISFELPRAFKLEHTHFDIGSKMMRFNWNFRQFHVWHFSCADMFLKDGQSPDRWLTGFLNAYGGFKGARFDPDGKGGITWRRRKPFLFGHRSEIARWCFRYKIGWRLIEETRQLVVWVYHYRKRSDLAMLPEQFQ
ncbi:MAG: hypothetical protein RRC34_08165 [Lentisphaeria bacterium]|nr:hypothetical protein [Lentisphaeria bacterium]